MSKSEFVNPIKFKYPEALITNAEKYLINCFKDEHMKIEKHEALISTAMIILQGTAYMQPRDRPAVAYENDIKNLESEIANRDELIGELIEELEKKKIVKPIKK